MYQTSQGTSQNNFFREVVSPAIYSKYPTLLKETYDNTQNQTEISKALYTNYQVKQKPEGKQYVEINYTRPQVQDVYLMRYFFSHSLLVPFVLDSLFRRETYDSFFHTTSALLQFDLLKTSFFGGGPCPEYCGLRQYLSKTEFSFANISSAIFDKIKWKFRYGNDSAPFFETDLAGGVNSFLDPISEEWVRTSDLIVIQNCLNEIPISSHRQLLMNMINIANLMKPSALMLVIERYGYGHVRNLLRDFHDNLNGLNNVQAYYSKYEQLELEELNNNVDIPIKRIEHLHDNWLWMSKYIKFHWLAISKK